MSTPIRMITAPNPGPMTLEGTNTWLVGSVVIDPGPADEKHLRTVLDAARAQAGTVTLVLLTHGHADHSEGAARFAELAGCSVRAYDRSHCHDGTPLTDGEAIDVGAGVDEAGLVTMTSPGHTWDSVAFLLPDRRTLFTGDTVLGRGTTMVAHPDGSLGPYLASLRRMLALARDGVVTRILPGHGAEVADPVARLEFYVAHREERLEQVRAALAAGADSAHEIVRRVYADVDRSVWPAAEQSVRAQLDYLRTEAGPEGI